MANISLLKTLSEENKLLLIKLYNEGLTQEEIGLQIGLPRRSVMKLCKHFGLKRSASEAGSIKIKSNLDDPSIIEQIKKLRPTHSLQQIVEIIGSTSLSSVDRICRKYNIEKPHNFSELQSIKMKQSWTDEKRKQASIDCSRRMIAEIKEKISQNSRKLWRNEEYQSKVAIGRTNHPRVSSIQNILYSILDDLEVVYYREYSDRPNDKETVIGPYGFDCVIPRDNKKTLLIECNGDYWHSLEKAIKNDKSKSTYINKYFSDQYELKYLWEHEFLCKERITETIKRWLDIKKHEIVDYQFNSVSVNSNPNRDDVKLLLSKYHYLPFVGKGGYVFGAYVGDVIIGACIFSPLVRQNVRTNQFNQKESLELSRLCIHPNYQKKNLASWFVSRCIKKLSDDIKLIISYCDTTYNHDGAVYKSLNFKLDGVVPSDYWYVDENGWVIHKRKLYSHAVKMSMKESQFAELYGYKKVFGGEKLRFILER